MTVRIALLICDTPAPTVIEKFGEYTILFTKLLEHGLRRIHPERKLELVPFDIRLKMQYPSLTDNFDGIAITGASST